MSISFNLKENKMKILATLIASLFAVSAYAADAKKEEPKKDAPKAEAKKEAPKAEAKKAEPAKK
jgi:hypothetical protein